MGLFPFATEHLLPQDEVKQITAPFWSDLTNVWASAWREYGMLSEEHRAMLAETPFAPPNVLYGFAQFYARQIFSDRDSEGIIHCPELYVFGFYIQDKVLIRFNSLRSDLIVHNSHGGSDRKDVYFRQDPISGLNNNATRLTVGGLANAARTDLSSVVISCQVGDSLHYSFPIDGSEDAAIDIPSPITDPQPDTMSTQLARRKPR